MRFFVFFLTLFFGFNASLFASTDSLPPFRVPDCLGVNIHFVEPRAMELDMIKDAGFDMIRMDLTWAAVERTKGNYDFSGYEHLTKALYDRSIRPLYILDYSNRLYEENRSVITKEGRIAFAAFAAEAVKTLKPGPIIWEIWNEPNIEKFWEDQPSAEDYVTLVEHAAKAMRKVDPDCTIAAPATSRIPLEFLEACFKKGLLNWIDAVSVHPYRGKIPETALKDYKSLKQLIRRYGEGRWIPILSGEWGYTLYDSDRFPVDEHRQARLVIREFLTNFIAGVRTSIWYDWHDDGQDPNEREHNFGIVFFDYNPKEAYRAASVFNTQLNQMQFIRRVQTEKETDYLALFGHANKSVLVAWTTGDSHDLAINEPILKTTATSMLGESISLKPKNGKVIVPVSKDPIYIPVQ